MIPHKDVLGIIPYLPHSHHFRIHTVCDCTTACIETLNVASIRRRTLLDTKRKRTRIMYTVATYFPFTIIFVTTVAKCR